VLVARARPYHPSALPADAPSSGEDRHGFGSAADGLDWAGASGIDQLAPNQRKDYRRVFTVSDANFDHLLHKARWPMLKGAPRGGRRSQPSSPPASLREEKPEIPYGG